jgi:hypothetical protein
MTILQVPEDVMHWLIVQGCEVIGSSEDTTTTPPIELFDLTRRF